MQVRAKYMALEPGRNRYVAHLRAIRAIQARKRPHTALMCPSLPPLPCSTATAWSAMTAPLPCSMATAWSAETSGSILTRPRQHCMRTQIHQIRQTHAGGFRMGADFRCAHVAISHSCVLCRRSTWWGGRCGTACQR